jgi:hypothetical protein
MTNKEMLSLIDRVLADPSGYDPEYIRMFVTLRIRLSQEIREEAKAKGKVWLSGPVAFAHHCAKCRNLSSQLCRPCKCEIETHFEPRERIILAGRRVTEARL